MSLAERSSGAGGRLKPAGPVEGASPLRGHGDFRRLWFGQSVSAVGNQVTRLALPLTAVLYLRVSTAEVGLLTSATQLAYLGPMLVFGVMVDRVRKRPLMIATDLGRAAVLAVVPLLAWLGSLDVLVLYAVALVYGCLTVIFELGYRSYLPELVAADDMLAGNSRLQSTASIAQVTGPGVGGLLVQLLGAPLALLADVASFVCSALSLAWIRAPDVHPVRDPAAAAGPRGVFAEIGGGLRFIYRHRVLRALAGGGAMLNVASTALITIFMVYAARRMSMSGGEIGLVFVGFGVGGVLAALTLRRILKVLGYGRLLLACYLAGPAGALGVPFVAGPAGVATAEFACLWGLAGFGIVAVNVVSMTLRQVLTPRSLQARVNASFKFLLSALTPVSAAAAGFLGGGFGLHPTLLVCALVMPAAPLWILFSPVRGVRTLADLRSVSG